jgi:hypothetical protein
MRYQYKYELVNGHIIAIDGEKRLLIDTGSPTSMSELSPIDFAGFATEVTNNFGGVSPESLSKNIDMPINALIGTDILCQFDMTIDSAQRMLLLGDEIFNTSENNLKIDRFMGIPILTVFVKDKKARMFFDTGAKLSYLDHSLTAGLASVGEEEDFYPQLGTFKTNIYDVPITIGIDTISMRVGNLPQLLQMTLTMANTQGILGTAFLEEFKVSLSLKRELISYEKI